MAGLPLTAKAGIVLIAGPCLWLASWAAWHNTRAWEPVDIPISLSRGHISTPVKIKVEGDYAIYLGTRGGDYARVPCSGGNSGECYLNITEIRAKWSLGAGKNAGIGGDGPVPESPVEFPLGWVTILGRFHADPGVYTLNLEILNNLSALNSHEPHLHIREDGGKYVASIEHRNAALFCACALVPIGIPMLILGAAARRRKPWRSLTQPGPLPGTPIVGAPIKVSAWRKPKFVAARTFSVSGRFDINYAMFALFVVVMVVWIFFIQVAPLTPHGLVIRTIPPTVRLAPTGGIMPLRIHVLQGKGSNYSTSMRGIQIGSQIVDSADLTVLLRRAASADQKSS